MTPGHLQRANRDMLWLLEMQHRKSVAERALRRPIEMIDRMFDQLEELRMQDHRLVPGRLRADLNRIEAICGIAPGVLRVGVRIGRLQDALFDLQGELLESLRGPYAEERDDSFGHSRGRSA